MKTTFELNELLQLRHLDFEEFDANILILHVEHTNIEFIKVDSETYIVRVVLCDATTLIYKTFDNLNDSLMYIESHID